MLEIRDDRKSGSAPHFKFKAILFKKFRIIMVSEF